MDNDHLTRRIQADLDLLIQLRAEPVPRRWHRCRPTFGSWFGEAWVQYCACGGTRVGDWGRWINRNSRLRMR